MFYFSHIFAAFDTNHNGTVDFDEFILGVALMTKNDMDSILDFSFEM